MGRQTKSNGESQETYLNMFLNILYDPREIGSEGVPIGIAKRFFYCFFVYSFAMASYKQSILRYGH